MFGAPPIFPAPRRGGSGNRGGRSGRDDSSGASTVATSRDTAHAATETLELGPLARFAVGQRLGDRYVVQAFLGEGGMGAVYRVLDEALGEDVALKVVRSHHDRAALRDEVRLAQRVTHRNVCRTYDLETIGDHACVKMEYVPGVTLVDRLHADGALPIDEAIAIVRALAEGLACAHARGIIHRDLKPGNVMLDVDGRPVLMDFGLAQCAHQRGAIAGGTPGYMSPEQASGEDVDERSDLYGLGCLAYEMLTGQRVFGKGTPLELATRHASLAPPDPRSARPDTPRWLARAVQLLLSKEPAARVRGAALLERGPRRIATTWLPIAIAVAVVVTLAAFAVHALAPRWRPDVTTIDTRFHDPAGPASLSPDHQLVFAADPELRGRRAVYVMPVDGGEPRVVLPDVPIASVRWTRDGRAILYATPDGHIYRQPVAGDPLQPVGPSRWLGAGREPDDCGGSIVAIVDRDLVRRDAHGDHVLVRGNAERELHAPRCDRDGEAVVFWRRNPVRGDIGDIGLVDRDGIAALTGDHHARDAVFTPAGTVVYATEREGATNLYELVPRSSAPPRRLTFGAGPDAAPEVSPDGERLVFSDGDEVGATRRMIVNFDRRPGL